MIAEAVLADPFEWSEAVLGKEPAEYCRWIKVCVALLYRWERPCLVLPELEPAAAHEPCRGAA